MNCQEKLWQLRLKSELESRRLSIAEEALRLAEQLKLYELNPSQVRGLTAAIAPGPDRREAADRLRALDKFLEGIQKRQREGQGWLAKVGDEGKTILEQIQDEVNYWKEHAKAIVETVGAPPERLDAVKLKLISYLVYYLVNQADAKRRESHA